MTPALSHSHRSCTEANLVEVGCASLGRRVCLCVVHGPVPADEDPTLEDLDHLHGDIQGDGDEVTVQDEAGDEGVYAHHPRLVWIGSCFRPFWRQVPTTPKQVEFADNGPAIQSKLVDSQR